MCSRVAATRTRPASHRSPVPAGRGWRLAVGLVLAQFLGLVHGALADADRPRILTIVESDSRLPLVRRMLDGLEAGLGPEVTRAGELFVVHLDLLRFSDPESLEHMRAFLSARFGAAGLDAVAVLGPNALGFVLAHRDRIAPGAPVVFGAVGQEALGAVPGDAALAGISGVVSAYDIEATLALARAVQPDATGIVVVAGSAAFDRQWRAIARSRLGTEYLGLPVRILPEASAADMLGRAARLDPRTIVLLLTVNRDAAGHRFIPRDFARDLAAASAAPVWTVYETQIGAGIVGGQFEDLDATGRAMGALLLGALAGETLPPPQKVAAGPAVDWRAMQRHRLDLDRLPEGTRLLFHDPSIWERYRNEILALAAIVLAQTATIAALLVQRRRFLRSQATLASERAQLIHVSRNLRLGQLSAALAHEINQPLAAIQANAEAGVRLAAVAPPDLPEIGEIFSDIVADTRRAAGIIANLRRLMVKGETELAEIDLNGVVRATLALVGNELAARGARVSGSFAPGRLMVRGNGPQLQQIVLNLAFNAAEAMAGLAEERRLVRVSTARLADGGCRLAVEDAGPGIDPDRREAVFRPFASTKATGLGVGLAICRNIAAAHGGTLAFAEPDGGRGARAVLTLPAPGAAT